MSKKNKKKNNVENNSLWDNWLDTLVNGDYYPKISTTYTTTISPTEEEFVSPIDHHIYDPPFTHVWWKDGTKTVVATHDEPYTEEHGLAMAWMRKIYPSRAAFLRDVKAGFQVKEK